MKNLIKLRSHPMYKPLTVAEVKVQRENRKERECQKRLVFGLIIILFLIALFVLSSRMGIEKIYRSSAHIKHFISEPGVHNATGLYQIYSKPKLLEYIKTTLFPSLHRVSWYNGKPLDTEKDTEEANVTNMEYKMRGWTVDYNTKLIGVARIRQQRVKRNSCNVPSVFEGIFPDCNSSLNVVTQDKMSYDVGWKKSQKRYFSPDSVWTYLNAWETETLGIFGDTGLYYYGGGYTEDLGHTIKQSVMKLVKLNMEGWFDELTRALFVEFNLYNINTNLFTVVSILIEHLPNGIYVSKIQVQAAHLMFKMEAVDIAFVVSMVLVVLILLYIVCDSVMTISRFSLTHYFSSWRSVNEFLIILSGVVTIIAYIVRIIYFAVYVDIFETSEDVTFTSFYEPLFQNYVLHISLGVTIALTGTYLLFLLALETDSVFAQALHRARYALAAVTVFGAISTALLSGIAFVSGMKLFKVFSSIVINAPSYRIIRKHLVFENENGFALIYSLLCLLAHTILLILFIYYYRVTRQTSDGSKRSGRLMKLVSICRKRLKCDWFSKSGGGAASDGRFDRDDKWRDSDLSHIKLNVMRMLVLKKLGHKRGYRNRRETMAGLAVLMLTKKYADKEINVTEEDIYGRNSLLDLQEAWIFADLQRAVGMTADRLDEITGKLINLNRSLNKVRKYLLKSRRKSK